MKLRKVRKQSFGRTNMDFKSLR